MFKKIAMAAPLAVLALSSSMVFAAGEAKHSITLVAHVPADGFYVVPADPSLVNTDQDMSYKPTTNRMGVVEGFFDMRNNNGSVHASLEAPASLRSGATIVPLTVTINNVEVTTTPKMVVGELESNDSYRAPIRIAVTSAALPPAGDYTGVASLIFDAVPPVAL